MKRLLIILPLVCCLLPLQAQIGVASFSEDITCQDARVHHPKRDKDGVLCALLKISTTEQDFNFETGSLGVVATEYRTGEVWLYLPAGTMRLKITHARLGSLEGDNIPNGYYEFPAPLTSGHVYAMRLTHERVQVVVGEQKMVEVMFQCNVPNATVWVGKDQKQVETFKLGWPTTFCPQGQITYRVQKNNYEEVRDTVVLHADTVIIINLTPITGSLRITTQPTATTITVDGTMQGKSPLLVEKLSVGTHHVLVEKEGYTSSSATINIHGQDTTDWFKELLEGHSFYYLLAQGAYGGISPSWGFTFGRVHRWGWWVSMMSGTQYPKANGIYYLDDAVSPFFNGEVFQRRMSITLGGAYKRKNLMLTAGLGFGDNGIYWNTRSGSPYRVVDYSHAGLDAIAGFVYTMGSFLLSGEALTTNFSTLEGRIGVGLILSKNIN